MIIESLYQLSQISFFVHGRPRSHILLTGQPAPAGWAGGTENGRIHQQFLFSLMIQLPSSVKKPGVFGFFPCFGVRFFDLRNNESVKISWPSAAPPVFREHMAAYTVEEGAQPGKRRRSTADHA
jgi:hypothetical protein